MKDSIDIERTSVADIADTRSETDDEPTIVSSSLALVEGARARIARTRRFIEQLTRDIEKMSQDIERQRRGLR